MTDGQSITHPEPDPAPFKVHLLTRAGRVMRARSEPVRAFSIRTKPSDLRVASLAGTTPCTTRTGKFGPSGDAGGPRVMHNGGEALPDVTRNGTCCSLSPACRAHFTSKRNRRST